MPRLFTGIEIPQSQRLILSMAQTGLPDVRWIDPGDFHITLNFIGDIESGPANEIVDAVSRREWQAPVIKLQELACFGGSKPSSIHAKVSPDPVLSLLSASLGRIMRRVGVEPDSRRFTPHVTIARCRGITPAKVAEYLSQRAGISVPPFQPVRFVLYSARESTGGGPYRIEHSWPFEQTPDADARR